VRKLGIRSAVICSDAFVSLGELQADALGTTGLVELFVLQHPLAGIGEEELAARVEVAAAAVLGWLETLEEEGTWSPT
jgi:hypothetical protein